MPKVHIDGFIPGDKLTSVRIYDAKTFGKADALELWAGYPDEIGSVCFKLPRHMVGSSIQLTAVGGKAKYYRLELPATQLGVFHTVNLEFDRVLHEDNNPFTTELRTKAEARVQNSHRHAKYRNYLLTALFVLTTILSVYIGILISDLSGLAAGAALTIGSLLLGNYASGWSRGV